MWLYILPYTSSKLPVTACCFACSTLAIMDNNGDKRLTKDELKYGLQDYGIELNIREMDEIFNYFGAYCLVANTVLVVLGARSGHFGRAHCWVLSVVVNFATQFVKHVVRPCYCFVRRGLMRYTPFCADRDRNGVLDVNEFLIGIRGELNERRRKMVRMAFNILDKDRSGE
jgi:hypothetical protein